MGRDTETVSTLPSLSPSWKQEVNRRLAEHKNRKGSSAAEPELFQQAPLSANAKAAAAAARVAARYANAPSYSEILADDARAAVRAAEAASRAALEAQAAAESVLAGLEAVSAAESVWERPGTPVAVPERPVKLAAEPVRVETVQIAQARRVLNVEDRQPFAIRWEPDFPEHTVEPEQARAVHGPKLPEIEPQDWREPVQTAVEAIEVVEPAQPIHANLIEFPRELVATRKARPRREEGPLAAVAEPGAQLSIFEVDPGTISIQPVQAEVADETLATEWTVPNWQEPEWALPELPAMEPAVQRQTRLQAEYDEELLEDPAPAAAPPIELATLGWRLLSITVNGTLIMGAVVGAAMATAYNMAELPPLREIEIGGAVALVLAGVLYQLLFFVLAKGTPGMKYAHISLCTFDGGRPSRARRCGRLLALLLSLLPVGLGIVWALFDESHLFWHDRLSKTYMRKY